MGSNGAQPVPMRAAVTSIPRPTMLKATAISSSNQPMRWPGRRMTRTDPTMAFGRNASSPGTLDRFRITPRTTSAPRTIGAQAADSDLAGAERVPRSLTGTGPQPRRVSLRTGAVRVRRADRMVALLRTFRQSPPLAILVDAHDLGVDGRLGHAHMAGEVLERLAPEPVVELVGAHHVGQFVERVGRPLERLGLGHGHLAVAVRGEGDPRGEGVAFGRHERERLIVRIQDHHPGAQLDRRSGHRRDVEQGDLARRDPGEWRVELGATRPERRELVLPRRDELLGRQVGPVETDAERLLPQLAEPLERPGDALAADRIDLCAGDAGRRQAVDRRGPVRGIAVRRGVDGGRRAAVLV